MNLPRKRSAQLWALILADELYRRVEAGTPLPHTLSLPPVPKNRAVRMVQEVGSAKKQRDSERAADARPVFAFSLRSLPTGETDPDSGIPLHYFQIALPFVDRRYRGSPLLASITEWVEKGSTPVLEPQAGAAPGTGPSPAERAAQARGLSAPVSAPTTPSVDSLLSEWLAPSSNKGERK